MVSGSLDTTNVLLGVMAAVSVVELLALVAAGVVGFRLYRRTMQAIEDLERRQLAPLTTQVQAILEDVKHMSARVRDETDRVNDSLRSTLHRVDETAEIVRTRLRSRAGQALGVVRAARTMIEALLVTDDDSRRRPAHPAGDQI